MLHINSNAKYSEVMQGRRGRRIIVLMEDTSPFPAVCWGKGLVKGGDECLHSEVGVTREGPHQQNLGTEITGQNGWSQYKPVKIWGHIIPQTNEFTSFFFCHFWLLRLSCSCFLHSPVFPPQPCVTIVLTCKGLMDCSGEKQTQLSGCWIGLCPKKEWKLCTLTDSSPIEDTATFLPWLDEQK